MAYKKNVDYQALINQAVANKDYNSAAQYEQQRNDKIDSEKLSYQKTNNYTGNLDKADYSSDMNDLMNNSGSADTLQYLLNKRNEKVNTAKNLQQYSNDDVMQRAMEYIKNNQEPQFDFSKANDMNSVVDSLLNNTYDDFKGSSQYDALRQQYAKNGKLSMNDTIGQVSARTGGLASSYAAQAGNQTYNDWMDKLENAALSMYQQNRSDQKDNLSALETLYGNEYGEYSNKLSQYNTDRNYNYQKQTDDRTFDYNKSQDQLANDWTKTQWDYQLDQNTRSQLEEKAKTLAASGIFTGYKALGYNDAEIAQMKQDYLTKLYQKSKGSGVSGGSGGSGSSKVTTAYDPQAKTYKEDKIFELASKFYTKYPNVTLDSRTVDEYLAGIHMEGDQAQLFKAALEEYGAKYSDRR